MATSTRTRRKASDSPAAPTADRPADAVADTPPPAPTAPAPTAPARKAAARKRATAAAAPAEAAPVAQAAPTPAAAAKPARKTAARKAAVKAPEAVAAPDVPAPATVDETQAAKPATKAAATRIGAEAAGKKVAAKKAAAKKTVSKKAAPTVAPKKAARPAAPKAAAAEPAPEPTADLPAIAGAETPLAPPSAPEAVPVTEVAATGSTPDAIAPDSAAAVAAPSETADTPADDDAPADAEGPSRSRRNRNRRRRGARAADPQAQATAEAVLAVLAAPAPDTVGVDLPAPDSAADSAEASDTEANVATATDDPAPASAPDPEPPPPPTGPAHSRIACLPGDAVRIAWQPGHACPPALRQAAQRRTDDAGLLSPEDDAALPLLLRLAQEGGHTLQVDTDVWPLLAAHRDARHRLSALEAAYPDGPASPALQHLLRVPLPLFQAEGALFAVIAGRALIADERGLGKGVQAIAAARLWQRHFGVQRVLVLCAPAQRAAWQRAWQRLAGGDDTQVIDGGHHQRPAQWAATAGVRILAPEALQTDAAHLAHWAPDLVIVDEPQQLGLQAADWAALQDVPQALVLSGAPLADLPALTDTLVAWLDTARLGPLAALRELQAASRGERTLDEGDVERLSASLSRLMLQRQRDDVADQLPPVVHSERLLPLAPGQRAAHDRHAAVARRLLAGWQASGWCSDADQWRLAQALHGMQQACHRADPADPASALAEATVQALAGTLAELAQLGTGGGDGGTDGAPQVAVLCASVADQAQLAGRLAEFTGGARPVRLLAPGEHLPGGIDVVLQAGVPWRVRRQPGGPRGEAPAGQQWIHLVAQDGIDGGLFDTLAARIDAPRGPGDGGARGYLQGEALQQWLALLQAALAATPVAAA